MNGKSAERKFFRQHCYFGTVALLVAFLLGDGVFEFQHGEVQLYACFGVGGLQIVAQYVCNNVAAALHKTLLCIFIGTVRQLGHGARQLAYLGKRLHNGNGGLRCFLAFENGSKHVEPPFR